MRRLCALIPALLSLSLACAKHNVVEVPPRVDLHDFQTIGIVEFESTAKGNLSAFATQRFVEALQDAQPGTHVLELGNAARVEGAGKDGGLDPSAVKKIGEKYNIDALVIGELIVKDVRPRMDVVRTTKSMGIAADVDAVLVARLFDTREGATVWTRMSDASRTVAQVGVSGTGWRFDAKDPEHVYGELVNGLVNEITYDFRPSYSRE